MARRIRQAIKDAGGVRRLAKAWGISPSYVSDLQHGRRVPGPEILNRLGLRKVTGFVDIEPSKATFDRIWDRIMDGMGKPREPRPSYYLRAEGDSCDSDSTATATAGPSASSDGGTRP